MNLYEIASKKLEILQAVQDLEGELTPELEADLTAIEVAMDEKLKACCCVLKNLDALAELHAAEIKRLTERKRAIEARHERLKEWVAKSAPEEGWSNGVHTLAWRKSKSVEVEIDAEKLPLEFSRMKFEANKTAIKEAIEAGAVVEGCKLVEKKSLQVK